MAIKTTGFYVCDNCGAEIAEDPLGQNYDGWIVVRNPPERKGIDRHFCSKCWLNF